MKTKLIIGSTSDIEDNINEFIEGKDVVSVSISCIMYPNSLVKVVYACILYKE